MATPPSAVQAPSWLSLSACSLSFPTHRITRDTTRAHTASRNTSHNSPAPRARARDSSARTRAHLCWLSGTNIATKCKDPSHPSHYDKKPNGATCKKDDECRSGDCHKGAGEYQNMGVNCGGDSFVEGDVLFTMYPKYELAY